MNITTIMPTRGRPTRATFTTASHNKMANLVHTHMVWVLDIEDPKLPDYYIAVGDSAIISEWSGNMVERTNKEALAIAKHMPKDDIIGWCADDNEFVTPGWDEAVTEAFDDPKVAFVVPNDNHWKGSKATNIFMRASVVRKLGYFALPTQEHLFVDDAWIRLAVGSNSLAYLDDVTILHHNPYNTGVGTPDAQHVYTNRPELYGIDGAAYSAWLNDGGLTRDIRLVHEALP